MQIRGDSIVGNRSSRCLGFLVAFNALAGNACIAQGRVDKSVDADSSLVVQEVEKQVNMDLPYPMDLPFLGQGNITILNDSTLLIRFGAEPHFGTDESGEMVYVVPDSTTFAYVMTTPVIAIVDNAGDVLLRSSDDINDLSGVDSIQYATTEIVNPEQSRQAVLSMSGEMLVEYDRKSGALSIQVVDGEDPTRSFTASFQYVSGTEKPVSKDAVTSKLFSGRFGISQRLNLLGGSCQTICSGGSECTQSCPDNKACLTYCDGSTAVCKCIKKPIS